MNRDEILERSRNSDKNKDEYQTSIELKGRSYGSYTLYTICTIFYLLTLFFEIDGTIYFMNHTLPLHSIFMVPFIISESIYQLYRYYFLKKRWNLLFGLFLCFGFLMFLYRLFITGLS